MLYEQITTLMKEAMKDHDKDTLNTIRLLKSAIDLYKINNKMDRLESPSDEIVIDVVSKQVKTHKESIEEFKKANREDLISALEKEITVLSKFLPEQASDEEIDSILNEVFNKINPTSMKDMGLIMKEVTPLLKGKADMGVVSNKIKSRLN